MPSPLPISDRPIRLAVVGLGQIAELCLPPYLARDDVEVVGLCDRDVDRIGRWQSLFPDAKAMTALGDLRALDVDVVDVLVPTPAHADVVTEVLRLGVHV